MKPFAKFLNKKNIWASVGVGITVLALLLLFAALTHSPKIPDIPKTPTEDDPDTPHSVIIADESDHIAQPYKTEPPRDRYIHIEAEPGDGLYNAVQKEDPKNIEIIEILQRLANYICIQQEYKDCSLIFTTKTDKTITAWIRCDKFAWRLRYYNDNQKVIADGAFSDFIYVPFEDWNHIYGDRNEKITGIEPDIMISLIGYVMTDYPYQVYNGSAAGWYWDQIDEENLNIRNTSVYLQNETYKDVWLIEYANYEYICMYRDILHTQ